MSVVTLVSGGLDSALMASMLFEENVVQKPLFIDYGQLNIDKEWASCQMVCNRLSIGVPEKIEMTGYGKSIGSGITSEKFDIKDEAFLPGRNLLFLLTASAYAYRFGYKAVAIGLLNDQISIFPDQTMDFLEKAHELIKFSLGCDIKILAPLMIFNKRDIIFLTKERSITNTYSCHAGTEEPCGKCISCLEFINAGIIGE